MYVHSLGKIFLVAAISLFLSSCGGGGSGGGSLISPPVDTGTGGGGTTVTGAIELTISGMVDATGAADNVLAGNEVATLTAKVTQDGEPINVTVLFETSIGTLLQSSAQSTNGTATVQITGNGTAGAATVTAKATLSDGTDITSSIIVQTSSDQPNLRIRSTTGQGVQLVELRAAESIVLVAEVVDWNGGKLAGVGITFESTAVSLSGTTLVTDANGQFPITLTGVEAVATGTVKATATFGAFSLSDQIIANSLGVNTSDNKIVIDSISPGADGTLSGNEVVGVALTVFEDGVPKPGISVVFTTTAGTLSPASKTSDSNGKVTTSLRGAGTAGTLQLTASATLSNGIAVQRTATVQTSADKPSLDLIVKNKAGVTVSSFGANQEIILEAVVRDFDGTALKTGDTGVNVTFAAGTLGTLNKSSDLTKFGVCPVNGIKASTDCAFVTLTSNTTAQAGSITVSATLNGIALTDTENVTNTGANSGAPDQNSFTVTRLIGTTSYAIDRVVAIEGDVFNNQTATVRVDLADFFNNPVPNGTLVKFTSELGDIASSCTTTSGTCEAIFNSADPRAPNNSEVSFKNLDNDHCPSALILDEVVTIDASGNGLTDYRVSEIKRVALSAVPTSILTKNTQYSQNANGITCITCTAGQTFKITYKRLWLDEENDADPAHVLATPGVGTEPFLTERHKSNGWGTPCFAGARSNLEQITGSIDPTASVSVTGVGTLFRTELAVGDFIKVNEEVRKVATIVSDTSLTVTTAFTNRPNDLSPERIAAPAYFGGMGQPYGGLSTILAYAVGEETFIDGNGNDQYDFGETFFDLAEPFLDKNGDGVFGDINGDSNTAGIVGPYRDGGLGTNPAGKRRDKSSPFCYGPLTVVGALGGDNDSTEASRYCYQDGGEEESLIDTNGNGVMDVGNGIYNGSRCLTPIQDTTGDGVADSTVCTTELVDVRREVEILMSGSFARTEFRAGGGGANGGGEVITGITNKGGQTITESLGLLSSWTITNATVTTASDTTGMTVNTRALDTNSSQADTQEDVQLFSITKPFSTTQATYTLNFDVTSFSNGSLEVFIGGVEINLDEACASVKTCKATGFTIADNSGNLIFSAEGNGGFVGVINNVKLTGITTGTANDFKSSVAVTPNNGAANVTDFNVGDTINATTVFAGVSERAAPSGTVPTLTTTLTSGVFWFTDKYNGQLPQGTVVELSSDTSGCTLTQVQSVAATVAGTKSSGKVTVGTTAAFGATYTVKKGGGGSGSISATVTSPIGNITTDSISCNLF